MGCDSPRVGHCDASALREDKPDLQIKFAIHAELVPCLPKPGCELFIEVDYNHIAFISVRLPAIRCERFFNMSIVNRFFLG